MNTHMQTALAAWTLFSLFNQTEEQWSGFRKGEEKVEEVKYEILPGYNQATEGQSMKIQLNEQVESRFMWRLVLPKDIELVEDLGNKDQQHVWIIKANKVGKYKVVAEYIDKKRFLGVRKRVVFEIEVLPCHCDTASSNTKVNTTK